MRSWVYSLASPQGFCSSPPSAVNPSEGTLEGRVEKNHLEVSKTELSEVQCRCCTWGARSPFTVWGMPCWKTELRRRSWGSWWTRTLPWASSVPCWKDSQGASGRALPAFQGGDPDPLLSPVTPGAQCPALSSSDRGDLELLEQVHNFFAYKTWPRSLFEHYL